MRMPLTIPHSLRPRVVALAAVAIISGAAAYIGVSAWRYGMSRAPILSEELHNDTSRVNPFATAHGPNLIAYVLTSADCGWAGRPSLMRSVGELRRQLRTAHDSSYAQISVVGIALDDDVDAGIQFFNDISGPELSDSFDQVLVGGSWLNDWVVNSIWRGGEVQALVPQIVLVERAVGSENYLEDYRIHTEPMDRLIKILEGNSQILSWMDAGLPLPAQRHGTLGGSPISP